MYVKKVKFQIRIEYRVQNEDLIPGLAKVLGKGRRKGLSHVWTRKVTDLRKFARTMSNLRADLDANLIWRCLP